jgi:hypothetical protein
MYVELITQTSGTGPNTVDERSVIITVLSFGFMSTRMFPDDPFSGELRANFEGDGFTDYSWNTEAYGHICGDPGWLKSFKEELRKKGFSERAVRDIKYGDISRQGTDYVCLDVGQAFYASYRRLLKKMLAEMAHAD